MGYIDNYKFKEILKAGKDGNKAANDILSAIRHNAPQSRLNALVESYYKSLTAVQEREPIKAEPMPEELQKQVEVVSATEDVVDLTDVLDKDLDGVISEDEIDDIGVVSFLRDKIADNEKVAKDLSYFGKYDKTGRASYKDKRVAKYKEKLDDFMRKVDREYLDIDRSVPAYKEMLLAMEDNSAIGLNDENTLMAYKEMVSNDRLMGAFPRAFDDNDKAYVQEILSELVGKYGRDNVLMSLNGIKYGNKKHREDMVAKCQEHLDNYTRKLSELLG